jgi:hypothetical protein
MNRVNHHLVWLLMLCGLVCLPGRAMAQDQPNIVLVFMDNFGWGEPGFNGGSIIRGAPTPQLDQLAAEGLRLTNFNVEAQCTPSRSAIMTGKASGRSIPLFPETHPHTLAWLQRLAAMLRVKDPKALDPATPLFLSRVRNKDGNPRAIARETAWRIIKAIPRENELSGKVGTHSTRKTLVRKVCTWANDIRVVQRILGHRSLASTEGYLKSLTDHEVWTAFRTSAA